MSAKLRFSVAVAVVAVAAAACATSSSTESDAVSRPHPGLTDAQFTAAVRVARSEVRRLQVNLRIATAKMVRGTVDATNTGHRCRSAHLHIEILGSFPAVAVGDAATTQGADAPSDEVHAELIEADPHHSAALPHLGQDRRGTSRPNGRHALHPLTSSSS